MLKRFEKYGSQREIVEIPPINNKVLTDSSSEQSSHSSPAVQITLSSSSQSSSKDDSLPLPQSSARKSVPSHHNSIIQRIDQMLQPYQDEFINLFSNLRKKIRLDLEGNFADVPRPKRNAITQTDMSQDHLSKERTSSALNDKEHAKKTKSSNQGGTIKKDPPSKHHKSDNKDTKYKEGRKSRDNKEQKKRDETNYLGSFDRGNEVEFIIKGMKCSNDGSRKYLVRWKQVEGH